MAARAQPLGASIWIGGASCALLLFLTLGTLGAIASRADWETGLGANDWTALRFTVFQAVLSATLSIGLAIPTARALARRQFWGRNALIMILGAPFILPVIVAILGIVSVYGGRGALSTLLGQMGLPPIDLYGLTGILLAHVFFNLPLATRLILQGWLAIPSEQFRLADSLSFRPADIQRHIEWPMLRNIVPPVFVVIFLICLTSFTVVLALGGGPKSTTIELAIYQAFKFDFDLGKAALLGVLQFGICGLAGVAMIWLRLPQGQGSGLDRALIRQDADTGFLRLLDGVILSLVATFLLAPLISIFGRGIFFITDLPELIWMSALRSLVMALSSTALCITMALGLSHLSLRLGRIGGIVEVSGFLVLSASPLVMGTGLFIFFFPFVRPSDMALPITVIVNAAMALPFVLAAILPAIVQAYEQFGRLADSLGITGSARMIRVTLPRVRKTLGFGAGLSAALAMGDLGVVTLFGTGDATTLPLEMYRLMGAYRLDQASGAALLLLAISLTLFWIFDMIGRRNA